MKRHIPLICVDTTSQRLDNWVKIKFKVNILFRLVPIENIIKMGTTM